MHPFFWPVLYCLMWRIIRWMEATGHMDLLVRIHWRGGIAAAYTGDKDPDPSAYRPLPRNFRPLTDAIGASDLRTNLEGFSPLEEDTPFFSSHATRVEVARTIGASRRELYPHSQTHPGTRIPVNPGQPPKAA